MACLQRHREAERERAREREGKEVERRMEGEKRYMKDRGEEGRKEGVEKNRPGRITHELANRKQGGAVIL